MFDSDEAVSSHAKASSKALKYHAFTPYAPPTENMKSRNLPGSWRIAFSLLVFSFGPSGRTIGSVESRHKSFAAYPNPPRRVGRRHGRRTTVGNAPVNRGRLRQAPVDPVPRSTPHRRPRPLQVARLSTPLAAARRRPAVLRSRPARGRHGSSPWRGRGGP